MSVIYTMFIFVMFWNSTVLRINTLIFGVNTPTRAVSVTVNILLTTVRAQRLNILKIYVNMATQSRFPDSQVTCPGLSLNNTLRELSVVATLLTNRPANQQEDLCDPDEYHKATRLANQQMAWLVLATEEVNKCKEAGATSLRFQSLHGSIRLPRWDKVILATSPAAALATWLYHAVEHHVVTTTRPSSSW